MKLHFKTQGNVKPIFINTPFTQTSVSTGKGFYHDVVARFWQAERHGRGIQTAAYATKKFFESKKTFRDFMTIFWITEIHILNATIVWVFVGAGFQ